ncbi:uncharacterized protein I206_100271 [Kwoniella pini CBS 10737]|uniref:GPI mannosyltransferase 2 n=1 Tax=Kwoniella pini CBS 10737 TaxID=1296096 RepID=A0A1B9IE21_9TREE|nr:uncharacterized protein I206_01054 [Kwoniella pini CBS 10737]OCF53747.1 hypothetical protein I206_01054 [Kwoniella pini CBS 10737]
MRFPGWVEEASRLHPTLSIGLTASIIRLVHITFLYLLSWLIPPFDNSHNLVSSTSTNTPGLRWDAIHFISIAKYGYIYEQHLAFQPLFMGLLRLSGECLAWLKGNEFNENDLIWGGMTISSTSWIGSCMILHKMTTLLFNSSRFALLTTILYMIPPTPIPSLPYTEPLYSLIVLSGIYLLVVKKQYILTGILFAFSTATRATGIFNVFILAGVIILGDLPIHRIGVKLLIERLMTRSWKAIIPCLITMLPFLLSQWYAYQSFCDDQGITSNEMRRPWCDTKLPFVYHFVQKEYWNIGFLNYWTIANIPNILLPLPIIITSFLGIINHFKSLKNHLSNQTSILTILYLHHVLILFLVLFNSHIQILLRTCITDPVIWWNVTSISINWGKDKSVEKEKLTSKKRIQLTKIGKIWISWCLIWGTLSTILWIGHYPPA